MGCGTTSMEVPGLGREEGGKGKYRERWEEGSEPGEEDSGRGPGATERVWVARSCGRSLDYQASGG
jgi:hypothetical protein